MVGKSLAAIRIETIDELLKKYKSNEEIQTQLRNGFIPEELQAEYQNIFDKKYELIKFNIEPATDLELSQYSNWFYIRDNKIIGKEQKGSGFINPIITKGDASDFDKIDLSHTLNIDFDKSKTAKQAPKEEKVIDNVEDFLLDKLESDNSETGLSVRLNPDELITIEESLKKYNSAISEDEIKAWVYYKRQYGNPMYGYEKYYLKTQKDSQTVVVTTASVNLKDQQFKDVKFVPAGTQLGIRTKFKNEYSGTTYVVVKNEFNELYYVDGTKVQDQTVGYKVEESELEELVRKKALCYFQDEYLPIPIYLRGSLYDIKDGLMGKWNREEERIEGGYIHQIISKFGKEIGDWHQQLIDDALKAKGELLFNNPMKEKRPFLSRDNELSRIIKITELNEVAGVNFAAMYQEKYEALSYRQRRNMDRNYDETTEYTLFEAFGIWFDLTINDTMLENTTKYLIKRLYIQQANYQKAQKSPNQPEETQEEIEAIKLNAKIEGEALYNQFITTCLLDRDMMLLNQMFNRQYNFVAKLDVSKIPVAFEANKHVFSDPDFKLNRVQRDGLAFTSATNGGCYAYSVGFGKTLVAIHTIAMLMKEGRIKRPLIAVPKPVYKNWKKEMFGFWSNGVDTSFEEFEGAKFISGALTGLNYKFNDWTNLPADEIQNKLIDPYTITLVTYQGLEKIGYSPALREDFSAELERILKGQNVSKDEDEKSEKKTEREKELVKQNIYSKMGMAEADTLIDIDVCGFDHLTIDEAHNFKNVFGSTALDEGVKDSWRIAKKNSTKRAIKLFLNTLYIQNKYNGNVILLTATPFINSPLEIYSMLALIGYSYLKKYNIENMQEFLSMFIETMSEYTVDMNSKIKVDTVIKSFQNKNILRDILYRHFDYQDNPMLAGVSRPCKINFPNSKVNTYLQMSLTQLKAQEVIKAEALNYDPKFNRGAMGRALNWAKSNAITPFLVPSIPHFESLEEFVNESPKIKYAIECIKTVKQYAEERDMNIAGQIIYINRGKDLFEDLKEAINEFCGYRRKIKFGTEIVDEVEIITSANSIKDIERKEIIKDAFNKGFVKVIIGTSTIKEGVNLQENGAVTYDLDLDWNPTDFTQLEGRTHRQGNKFKYVRITVPLVQNTLDSFINQKLDEKSKRIATIWDKESDANSIEENAMVDPMEIKFALIDDPNELAKMKHDETVKRNNKKLSIAKDRYDSIFKIETSISDYAYHKEALKESVQSTLDRAQKMDSYLFRFKNQHSELTTKEKDSFEKAEKYTKELIALLNDYINNGEVKSLVEANRQMNSRRYEIVFNERRYEYSDLSKLYSNEYSWGGLNQLSSSSMNKMVAAYSDCRKFERTVLASYNLSLSDDLGIIKDKFKAELDLVQAAIDFTETPEYQEQLMAEIREELNNRAQVTGDVMERVSEFAKTNNLLSYPFDKKDADNCEYPTADSQYTDFNKVVTPHEFLEDETDTVIRKSSKAKVKVKTPEQKATEEQEVTQISQEAKKFIPDVQLKIIRTNPEFEDARQRINEQVATLPLTYATEDLNTGDKMAGLHYFRGGSDWYIIENDRSPDGKKHQCFGYVILNGDDINAEFGYIDVEELKRHAELDLYWTPVPMRTLLSDEEAGALDDKFKPEEPEMTPESVKEAIEMLQELMSAQKGKDKKETKEAIEMLQDLISG